MKKRKSLALAILLSLIIALAPITAFAAQLNDPFASARVITLTPEARDIALYDFDYLVSIVLETVPTQNIIYRRLGVTAADFFAAHRQTIYDMTPMPSILYLMDPERWTDAPEDDLSIAADYLYSILFFIQRELGNLGHLGPVQGAILEPTFFSAAYVLYHGINVTEEEWAEIEAQGGDRAEFERFIHANIINTQLRYELYNTPAVLQFYGIDPLEFDFYVDQVEFIGNLNPDNIITNIIEPGRIAYFRIVSFFNNVPLDAETLFPFYEEIQDFEHLIIDLRSNTGGWSHSFPTNVMAMLMSENSTFNHYEFHMANERTADFFEYPLSFVGGALYGVFPIEELVADRNMYQFNPDDLALLDYASVWTTELVPAQDNIPFEGKIWILVNRSTASASEMAVSAAAASGFATIVGTPTAGVTGVVFTYVPLPNTGIMFRTDIAYTTDQYGRSFEEFGIIPHIPNAYGMNALETVLAVINGEELPVAPPPVEEVEFVSLRLLAYSLGYNVAWDGENNQVLVTDSDGNVTIVVVSVNGTFNDDGTVFVSVQYAEEIFG